MSDSRFFSVRLAFFVAGLISFFFSVYLWFFESKDQGIFVAIWVPSLWSLGALVLTGAREQR